MDKKILKKTDLLMDKVDERISGRNINESEVYLTAKQLKDIIIKAMSKYNLILFDKVNKDKKALNRSILSNRLLNKRIPYIYSIIPTIYEDGKEEITVIFSKGQQCKGIAVIKRNLNVSFEFMRSDSSISETMCFLNSNISLFKTYFEALDSFKEEYPGISYEWNKETENEDETQLLDDGFISVKYNLNNPSESKAFLSNIDDMELSRIKTSKYGEIYDYVEFYNDAILNSFVVDIDKLNPLYRKIVENSKKEMFDKGRVLKIN